jgi:hypothetical protein
MKHFCHTLKYFPQIHWKPEMFGISNVWHEDNVWNVNKSQFNTIHKTARICQRHAESRSRQEQERAVVRMWQWKLRKFPLLSASRWADEKSRGNWQFTVI